MPKTVPKTDRPTRGRRCNPGSGTPSPSHERQQPVRIRDARTQGGQRPYPTVGRAAHPNRPPSPPSVSSSTDQPSPVGRVTPAASNYLLEALHRIRELQDELDFLQNDPYAEDTDEDDEDDQFGGGDQQQEDVIGGQQAEAIGWAVCARETIQFLQREGIAADSPLLANLRQRLIGPDRRREEPTVPDDGLSC
ncbi:uncharacterized protein LOC128269805 [Anopheles cruzii]|uniref:uncharacterized protein LOC128269805 n=1 Tax=Anopheles cruzii TaxID=68878 RepID=UPI0022EC6223|nr:uncharacterized protein LOC128269805 [Anopheles cruzii]